MGKCEKCRGTVNVQKCDECLTAEMTSLGFDVVSCGYRQMRTQRARIVVVRCPDCRGEREVVPGNARAGLGIRCAACAGKARIGQHRERPRQTCPRCGVEHREWARVCDECVVEEMQELGHNALGVEMVDGIRRVRCRCSVCEQIGMPRRDDLKRERVHSPWRCAGCNDRNPVAS